MESEPTTTTTTPSLGLNLSSTLQNPPDDTRVTLVISSKGIKLEGNLDPYAIPSVVEDLANAYGKQQDKQARRSLIEEYTRTSTFLLHLFAYAVITVTTMAAVAATINFLNVSTSTEVTHLQENVTKKN